MSDDLIFNVGMGGPSQSSIVIKPELTWVTKVTNRLEPYKSLPNKYRPALEAVADYMRQKAIPRTFEQEGPGWRQLSKRTQAERSRAGFDPRHPILVRTGDLFRELTERSHPKHVEILRVGPQARIVLGGSSEKFIRNQLGSSVLNLPSRPMIPGTGRLKLSSNDEAAIKQLITDKIKEAVKH